MMERLFDIVAHRNQQDPNSILLAGKQNGTYRTYTTGEVWQTARKLAGGIQSLLGREQHLDNPEQQQKIAIISQSRPEWMIVDIGVQLTGAVLTPIYPTISPHELEFILKDAGVNMVFVATEELYHNFDASFKSAGVQHIFSFESVSGIANWQELIDKNAQPDEELIKRIKPETLATIIYTSGTTGDPKGVMLSHKNIVSNVHDSIPAFSFAEKGARALSFLPLNHIFERMVTYIYILGDLSIYYAESMDTIGANLKEVQPLVFTTVPRLLEKVYERIMNTASQLTGIKKALFFWALDLGKRYDNVNQGSWWYRFQLKLANKIIFNKWREALGGKVKAIVNGSAALQERLIRIFTAANVVIMEGYGLTETSPVVSVNRYESEDRRVGSIGPLIENVQVKLAEDGEILVKGNNVMMGYYKKPQQTAEAIQDGWFHTGDIGTWVEGRFLKITDRKKEIFKTSGGKYVAPQSVENKMKESMYIEQMAVIGSGRKFVSALIVPNFDQVRKAIKGAPTDNKELVKMPAVKELIQKQLDKYNPLFSHPEQVKAFTLLPEEWTINSGELTPSLKVKRKAIDEKYAKEIDAVYENAQHS